MAKNTTIGRFQLDDSRPFFGLDAAWLNEGRCPCLSAEQKTADELTLPIRGSTGTNFRFSDADTLDSNQNSEGVHDYILEKEAWNPDFHTYTHCTE